MLKIRMKKGDLIFYFALGLYLVAMVISTSEYLGTYGINMRTYVHYLVCPLLLLKIYFDRYYTDKNFRGIFLSLLFVIASYIAGGMSLAVMLLFILAARKIDKDALLKFYVIVVSSLCLFVLFSCAIGILPDKIAYYTTRFDRHTLGFVYTTYTPNFHLHLSLIIVYLLRDKIKNWHIFVIFLSGLLIFRFTATNSAMFCIGLLVLILFIYRKSKFNVNGTFFKIGAIVLYPILAMVSIALTINFKLSNPIMLALNSLLTNRLYYGHNAYEMYGIGLLGNRIEWNVGLGYDASKEYLYVDSSFMNIALVYGVTVLIVVIAAFTWLLYYASKSNSAVLYIVLTVLGVHSMWDPQLFDLKFDGFMFLLTDFFWNEKMDLFNMGKETRKL